MDNFNTLYYKKAAENYYECLPIGNGTMGAMCYSEVETEKIAVGHDTLYAGRPKRVKKEGAYEAFKQAQKYAMEGNYAGSDEELAQNFLIGASQPNMTFGRLLLNFDFKEYTDYQRTLDLKTALVESSFKVKEDRYRKTTFLSHPHKVLVHHVESENGSRFSFRVSVDCPLKHVIKTEEGILLVDGECPGDTTTSPCSFYCDLPTYSDKDEERGILFRGALKVICDGEVISQEDYLKVEHVSRATIYLAIETSYNGYDKLPAIEGKEYKEACLNVLHAATAIDYEEVKKAHILDHQALYNRVTLKIGQEREGLESTVDRLKAREYDKSDNSLYTLLFNMDRYLVIASGREGGKPINLCGVWNDTIQPAWHSNYITNLDTEMAYWPVLACNLPELMQPLTDFMESIAKAGEQTARDFYHAKGFVLHHTTDLWGFTEPIAGNPNFGYFPIGSALMCQLLFDTYEYTLDWAYLKERAFPVMKKAAIFYLDILTEDQDGSIILCPGTSPENLFYCKDTETAQNSSSMNMEAVQNKDVYRNLHYNKRTESGTAKSSAIMNMAVLRLFKDCKKACEVLGEKDDFYQKICAYIPRIKPLSIGEDGRILEWNEPLEEVEWDHRHMSHLYCIFPEGLITPEDKELCEAAKKVILAKGDNKTGWVPGWKTNLWARLREGNRAMEALDTSAQFEPSGVDFHVEIVECYARHTNLVLGLMYAMCCHGSLLSGMCEMLVQSDDKAVYLLPALPDRWPEGSLKGMAARGNITVDIEWKDGRITEYQIHGDLAGRKVVDCTV